MRNRMEQHGGPKAPRNPTSQETFRASGALASKEHVSHPTSAIFYKLGGTWDMVERDGKFLGTGNLDDEELNRLEDELGLHSNLSPEQVKTGEWQLTKLIYDRMKNTQPEPVDMGKHLESWCNRKNRRGRLIEQFGDYVTGPFVALYSGDSSHLRAALIAPIIMVLLDQAIKEPNRPILGAQGTDTADIAILSVLDALVFDTGLPPFTLTGANYSHREEGSDAPSNFLDLSKLTKIDVRRLNATSGKRIPGDIGYTPDTYVSRELAAQLWARSGAFWVFQGNVHSASDLIKVDPQETRRIENQSTFFSPHRTRLEVKKLLKEKEILELTAGTDWQNCVPPPQEHITRKITLESLYNAFSSVQVIDLGDQNSVWEQVEQILDPAHKAVVIEAHSLGNVNNLVRAASIEAAKRGKLVIDTSRTLIGDVNLRYAGSLLDTNEAESELKGSGSMIISSHRLNKTSSRAIAVRAILEDFNQQQTQELVDDYCDARYLN